MPSLMDLPPELRNRIAEHALVQTRLIRILKSQWQKGLLYNPCYTYLSLNEHLALTQVSCQLCKEILSVFYRNNTFEFVLMDTHSRSRDHMKDYDAIAWIGSLSSEALAQIRKVALTWRKLERRHDYSGA